MAVYPQRIPDGRFFFILSGFVIFHAYGGKLGSFDATKQFFVTRAGRLYPLHLTVLLAFLGWEWAKWAEVHWGTLPVAGVPFQENTPSLFFANLILAHAFGFWNHPVWNVPSWSISAEFYTCLIFALVALARPSRRSWLLISAVFAAVGLAVSWRYVGNLNSVGRYVLLRCFLGFFSGIIVWHIFAALASRFRDATVLQFGSGLLVVLFLRSKGWD